MAHACSLQIDEEYVQVTRQLRDTATELLRVQIKQANPGRADPIISAMLQERLGELRRQTGY